MWSITENAGELLLVDDTGKLAKKAEVTRAGSRALSDFAFTNGATHVRHNYHLALVER